MTGIEREMRRARYLIPLGFPRRGELVAGCAIAVIVAHLIFAQLTLVLAVLLHGASRMTRWRPSWLAIPAIAGLACTLLVGPHVAAAGFTAGPHRVLSYFALPGNLLRPYGAFRGMGGWLWRQLPIALVLAAAEAAVAGWLARLHSNPWTLPPARPGLAAGARRITASRAMRAGAVVARDGGYLGVVPKSGARVSLAWLEAAGGVLCTGAVAPDLTATSFQLVHAALRRRKPVIAIDLTGDPGAGAALAAVCRRSGTPLDVFGSACYEPFLDADPAGNLALALSLATPSPVYRRSCEAYLLDVFELMDAAPSGPSIGVLDDVLHLLNPGALLAGLGQVSVAHPRHAALADRIRVSARLVQSQPQVLAGFADQLHDLRNSPAGQWLRPAERTIDIGKVVRERGAVLFPLGAGDGSAAHAPGIAGLVCADLGNVAADLRRIGVEGDGLIWLCGCERLPAALAASLIADGAASGLPVLATTTDASCAAELAARVNAVLVHRLADEQAERDLAAAVDSVTAGQGSLCDLRPGEFLLTVNAPRPRVVELAQAQPAKLLTGAVS